MNFLGSPVKTKSYFVFDIAAHKSAGAWPRVGCAPLFFPGCFGGSLDAGKSADQAIADVVLLRRLVVPLCWASAAKRQQLCV